MKKFTVYTPCFNSAKYIERVYNSLSRQIYTDFEWLIINDGSTDNSSIIIKSLINNSIFDVNFIDLDINIGFNKSINLAVKNARGEFFLIAHADDEFDPEALNEFNRVWEGIDDKQKAKLQGVKCNCKDINGNLIGDPFPKDLWIADIFDLLYIYKIKGEKWGFIRTEILKEFPFPEDHKFVPETVIWHRIYYKYPAIFINKAFRTYYVDNNPSSLSKTTKSNLQFSFGKRLFHLDFINFYLSRVKCNFKLVVMNYIYFWRYSFESNIGIIRSINDIKSIRLRLISLLFVFPTCLYIRFRK